MGRSRPAANKNKSKSDCSNISILTKNENMDDQIDSTVSDDTTGDARITRRSLTVVKDKNEKDIPKIEKNATIQQDRKRGRPRKNVQCTTNISASSNILDKNKINNLLVPETIDISCRIMNNLKNNNISEDNSREAFLQNDHNVDDDDGVDNIVGYIDITDDSEGCAILTKNNDNRSIRQTDTPKGFNKNPVMKQNKQAISTSTFINSGSFSLNKETAIKSFSTEKRSTKKNTISVNERKGILELYEESDSPVLINNLELPQLMQAQESTQSRTYKNKKKAVDKEPDDENQGCLIIPDKSKVTKEELVNYEALQPQSEVIECRRSQRKKVMKYDVRDLLNKGKKRTRVANKVNSNDLKVAASLLKSNSSIEESDTDRSSCLESPSAFRGFSDSDNSKMSPLTIGEQTSTPKAIIQQKQKFPQNLETNTNFQALSSIKVSDDQSKKSTKIIKSTNITTNDNIRVLGPQHISKTVKKIGIQPLNDLVKKDTTSFKKSVVVRCMPRTRRFKTLSHSTSELSASEKLDKSSITEIKSTSQLSLPSTDSSLTPGINKNTEIKSVRQLTLRSRSKSFARVTPAFDDFDSDKLSESTNSAINNRTLIPAVKENVAIQSVGNLTLRNRSKSVARLTPKFDDSHDEKLPKNESAVVDNTALISEVKESIESIFETGKRSSQRRNSLILIDPLNKSRDRIEIRNKVKEIFGIKPATRSAGRFGRKHKGTTPVKSKKSENIEEDEYYKETDSKQGFQSTEEVQDESFSKNEFSEQNNKEKSDLNLKSVSSHSDMEIMHLQVSSDTDNSAELEMNDKITEINEDNTELYTNLDQQNLELSFNKTDTVDNTLEQEGPESKIQSESLTKSSNIDLRRRTRQRVADFNKLIDKNVPEMCNEIEIIDTSVDDVEIEVESVNETSLDITISDNSNELSDKDLENKVELKSSDDSSESTQSANTERELSVLEKQQAVSDGNCIKIAETAHRKSATRFSLRKSRKMELETNTDFVKKPTKLKKELKNLLITFKEPWGASLQSQGSGENIVVEVKSKKETKSNKEVENEVHVKNDQADYTEENQLIAEPECKEQNIETILTKELEKNIQDSTTQQDSIISENSPIVCSCKKTGEFECIHKENCETKNIANQTAEKNDNIDTIKQKDTSCLKNDVDKDLKMLETEKEDDGVKSENKTLTKMTEITNSRSMKRPSVSNIITQKIFLENDSVEITPPECKDKNFVKDNNDHIENNLEKCNPKISVISATSEINDLVVGVVSPKKSDMSIVEVENKTDDNKDLSAADMDGSSDSKDTLDEEKRTRDSPTFVQGQKAAGKKITRKKTLGIRGRRRINTEQKLSEPGDSIDLKSLNETSEINSETTGSSDTSDVQSINKAKAVSEMDNSTLPCKISEIDRDPKQSCLIFSQDDKTTESYVAPISQASKEGVVHIPEKEAFVPSEDVSEIEPDATKQEHLSNRNNVAQKSETDCKEKFDNKSNLPQIISTDNNDTSSNINARISPTEKFKMEKEEVKLEVLQAPNKIKSDFIKMEEGSKREDLETACDEIVFETQENQPFSKEDQTNNSEESTSLKQNEISNESSSNLLDDSSLSKDSEDTEKLETSNQHGNTFKSSVNKRQGKKKAADKSVVANQSEKSSNKNLDKQLEKQIKLPDEKAKSKTTPKRQKKEKSQNKNQDSSLLSEASLNKKDNKVGKRLGKRLKYPKSVLTPETVATDSDSSSDESNSKVIGKDVCGNACAKETSDNSFVEQVDQLTNVELKTDKTVEAEPPDKVDNLVSKNLMESSEYADPGKINNVAEMSTSVSKDSTKDFNLQELQGSVVDAAKTSSPVDFESKKEGQETTEQTNKTRRGRKRGSRWSDTPVTTNSNSNDNILVFSKEKNTVESIEADIKTTTSEIDTPAKPAEFIEIDNSKVSKCQDITIIPKASVEPVQTPPIEDSKIILNKKKRRASRWSTVEDDQNNKVIDQSQSIISVPVKEVAYVEPTEVKEIEKISQSELELQSLSRNISESKEDTLINNPTAPSDNDLNLSKTEENESQQYNEKLEISSPLFSPQHVQAETQFEKTLRINEQAFLNKIRKKRINEESDLLKSQKSVSPITTKTDEKEKKCKNAFILNKKDENKLNSPLIHKGKIINPVLPSKSSSDDSNGSTEKKIKSKESKRKRSSLKSLDNDKLDILTRIEMKAAKGIKPKPEELKKALLDLKKSCEEICTVERNQLQKYSGFANCPLPSKAALKAYPTDQIKINYQPTDLEGDVQLERPYSPTDDVDSDVDTDFNRRDETSDDTSNIRRSHRIKIISKTKSHSVGRGLVRDKERFIPRDEDKTISEVDDNKSQAQIVNLNDLYTENVAINKELEERLSQFQAIRENEYKCERVISKEAKKMTCDCFLTKEEEERGEFGCGEDCLNRLLMIECGTKCVVGDRCTNRRFQKNLYSSCKVFRTEKKGFGIMADEEILPGEFIMEYVGEVLNDTQFKKRAEIYSEDKNKHYYFMALRSDAIIDATMKGNISRFINHSCDPNAETQKWTVNGELRIGFFSKKRILPGDEVTFDYQFQRYGKEAQKCFCESGNCRGWIGEEPESEEEDDEEVTDSETEEEIDEKKDILNTSSTDIENRDLDPSTKGITPTPPVIDVKTNDIESVTNENEKLLITDTEKQIEVETKVVRKTKPKRESRLARKQLVYLEDPELEEEIQSLTRTGLKNQAHTLRLCRLMVRAKMLETRVRLLDILRTGEMPCKRLFLDYHGLRLLHGWMNESDLINVEKDLEMRVLLLGTLQTLPIPNKTMLKESKVFQTAESWANDKEIQQSPNGDSSTDSISTVATSSDSKSEIVKTHPKEANFQPKIRSEIAKISNQLISAWELLPEVFKIPKRERIEQMKEHEREADRQYKALNLPDDDQSRRRRNRERFGKINNYKFMRPYEKATKTKNDNKIDDNVNRDYINLGDQNISKVQRRQLFAAKVAQDAAEKRLAEERREFETKCKFFGLDPAKVDHRDLPFCVNPSTGQWYTTDRREVPTPPSHAHIKVPQKPQSTDPKDFKLPPMDLPPFWKFAVDSKGRIYYYHIKIRVSQWDPPIKIQSLSNETEIESAKEPIASTSKATVDDDIKNNGDSSSSYESDDSQPDQKSRKLDMDDKSNEQVVKEDRRKERYSLLVQEKVISPRREEDRLYNQIEMKKYKENKEKIRKRREEIRKRNKNLLTKKDDSGNYIVLTSGIDHDRSFDGLPLPIQDYLFSSDEEDTLKTDCDFPLINKFVSGDKIVDELDALKKERLKRSLPVVEKVENKKKTRIDEKKELSEYLSKTQKISSSKYSNSKYKHRKAKEKFRCDIAGVIVQHLTPYRKESCRVGKITNNDDFKHLARKLTHFVMIKELKHCDSTGQLLEVTESVKNKSREFIKKYMAKYGETYIRPENDPEFKDIPHKD